MPPKGNRIRVVETGEVYRGTRAVAEAIDGQFSAVAECLRESTRHTHKGYSFELLEDEEE